MKWSAHEIERLRELAGTTPPADIVPLMPGRSYKSVLDAGRRYGIPLHINRFSYWTTGELERLRELARTMPVADIALLMPGRTYDSISRAGQRYGISLRTPQNMVYCHICNEFRTKKPCPVCKIRRLLDRERARQTAMHDIPQAYREVYMKHPLGSRIDPVPPVPDYQGSPETVRAQCVAREAALVGNMFREYRSLAKRRQRMGKKALA